MAAIDDGTAAIIQPPPPPTPSPSHSVVVNLFFPLGPLLLLADGAQSVDTL